jgi:hypothetical protein
VAVSVSSANKQISNVNPKSVNHVPKTVLSSIDCISHSFPHHNSKPIINLEYESTVPRFVDNKQALTEQALAEVEQQQQLIGARKPHLTVVRVPVLVLSPLHPHVHVHPLSIDHNGFLTQ